MASPTSPTYFNEVQTQVIWGIEDVAAGTTPAGGASHPLYREPCISFGWTPARTKYTAAGYFGNGFTTYGYDETQHHAELQISVEYGAARMAAFATAAICGNASDTPVIISAGPQYTHTLLPSTSAVRCNTFTIYHSTGDTANVLRFNFATVSGITYSINSAGALICNITMVSKWPVFSGVALPTIDIYIGNTSASPNFPATRTLASQGVYTLFNNAGSSYEIVSNILALDMGFARNLEVFPNSAGLDPADICTGEMMMSISNLTAEYAGLGANKVYREFLNYVTAGDSSHKHTIAFTDADTNSLTVKFSPFKWGDNVTLDWSGVAAKISGSLDQFHDINTLNAASGVPTAPESIKIVNKLTTPMVT